jgi:hypothetical protein
LPDGVTAARVTLNHLVLVRIQVRQLPKLPAKPAKARVINDCLGLFYTSSYTNALGVLRFGITKAMSLKPIDQLIHSALRQYACPPAQFRHGLREQRMAV